MIMLSKPQAIMLAGCLLLLFLPVTAVHALYVVTLPSNTIYADDFENYPTNAILGSAPNCGTGTPNYKCGGLNGWSYNDNATGGQANITTTGYLSPSHSLVTTSPTSASAVFDLDKRFPLTNSTTQITISMWFIMSASYVLENLNNAHISIETWDHSRRLEAPLFLYSSTSGSCNPGIKLDFIGAPTNAYVGTDHQANVSPSQAYCIDPWNVNDDSRGVWHHYTASFDTRNLQWLSASVDGTDFTYLVKGLFFSNHGGGGDNEMAGTYPIPWRFEIGAVNAATHSLPQDTWYAWHDNLIITDTTPGQPNIIQFALRGAAWGLASMFSVIALVIGFIWIKMDLEGKGYTHHGLEYKKKILRGGIIIALAIAIIWGATAIFTG